MAMADALPAGGRSSDGLLWYASDRSGGARTRHVGQGTPQDGAEFGELPLRHVGRQDCQRPVERAGPLVELDRHASLEQSQRVLDAFVAVRTKLRRRDIGSRQV